MVVFKFTQIKINCHLAASDFPMLGFRGGGCKAWLAGLLVLFTACGGGNVKPEPISAISAEEQVRFDNETKALKKAKARSVRIERLVAQAESALLNGQLTLPIEDNAYDRFQAVLLLDPSNEYAKKGMQRILLAYIVRVHQALTAGRVADAKRMGQRVQGYFPKDPLVLVLMAKIAATEKTLNAKEIKILQASVDDGTRVLLPKSALSQRGKGAESILTKVALRVRESDEGVMIYARSDSEGRWIYKTMKKAAEGYRIRGDIRINHNPSIVFMAPLSEVEEQ